MTEEKNSNFVLKLGQYLNDNGISQADIAKKIGVSPAAISQYLGGNYKADASQLEVKISQFLCLEEERNKIISLQLNFVETTQSRAGLTVLRYCHKLKKMGMIIGDAGLGKSSVVKNYAANNKHAILVSAYYGILPTNMMDRILKELGVGQDGHENSKYETVLNALKGTDKLVIIDEAQHIKYGLLEKIRSIWDTAGVGIVISGNNTVVKGMIGKQYVYFDQLFSRQAIKADLSSTITEKDIKNILRNSNMPVLAESKDIVSFLVEKANQKGHYRTVENILGMAIEMLGIEENGKLTVDHLIEASKMIINVGGK